MVNREALPLIIGLFIPVVLVLIIFLYKSGYDFISLLEKIPILYYIIIFPIIIGFIFTIIKWRQSK